MSANSLRSEHTRAEVVARIFALNPESSGLWGEMSTARVLPHLADAMRLAFEDGEVVTADADAPFAAKRREWIHEWPWPEGKAKSPPEGMKTQPTNWETDVASLVDSIERFANLNPEELAASHPLFGRMTLNDWDALMFKHLDHHLRQFGV